MPKHRVEVFGQIIYAPEISYDDLLGLENEIVGLVSALLEDMRAEFIAFESEGDRTFFQCALQSCDREKAKSMAARLAEKIKDQWECKILFVDKMLFEHYFYALNQRGGKSKKLLLPEAGPIDKALAAAGG